MKKILCLGVATACLIATMAMAQQRNNARGNKCSYAPLQELIREARTPDMIQKLAAQGVDFNASQRCGGSALQLAIQRGNPEVLKALLEGGADVTKPVSMADFSVAGAPKEIPLALFAGYYAPRQDIMRLLISAGVDVTTKDSNGETIVWYMDQNPVLRNTEVADEIKGALLLAKPEEKILDSKTKTTLQKTVAEPKKQLMQKVDDPRVPQQQPILTKTGKDTIGYKTPAVSDTPGLPAGTIVIQRSSGYPTREIVEPDMPVK